MERLDDMALEKRRKKTKKTNVFHGNFWMWKTRLRVRRMTRLEVRISRRMLQMRLLYREDLVNEDLEPVEDMQFGGSLGRGRSIGLSPVPIGCGGEMRGRRWMLTEARVRPL
jgi:hypothetical protein